MATMKAVRIHGYGGPEVLQYEDAPRPAPRPGEVLIRVHATGVNPVGRRARFPRPSLAPSTQHAVQLHPVRERSEPDGDHPLARRVQGPLRVEDA